MLIPIATSPGDGLAGKTSSTTPIDPMTAMDEMPVRVVGKCGAYESDLADGIRWAVGIPIPGVPTNSAVALGFLIGDNDASKSVTASDILRAKGRRTQAASAANFIYDVDQSGTVDDADVSTIKQRAGLTLP